jgi:hypothetical protein
LFDRPDTAFSAGWIVPGTLAAGATGAFLGGSVAALDPSRPLFRATANAGIKCAVAGFMYFGGVTQLTALTSPTAPDATGPSSSRPPVPLQSIPQRLVIHGANGVLTGSLLSAALLGRATAPRGALLGLTASLPLWFLLEGRHQLLGDERVAERRGWEAGGVAIARREDEARRAAATQAHIQAVTQHPQSNPQHNHARQ